MTEEVEEPLSEKEINLLIDEQGTVLDKRMKKSERKELDLLIKKVEGQINYLESGGNFIDESSLAPSALFKRGIIS